jgi:hypothetical protein
MPPNNESRMTRLNASVGRNTASLPFSMASSNGRDRSSRIHSWKKNAAIEATTTATPALITRSRSSVR